MAGNQIQADNKHKNAATLFNVIIANKLGVKKSYIGTRFFAKITIIFKKNTSETWHVRKMGLQ